ncbi:unnamed protein product [Vicia faba]|uniref:Uncharacterized protein n=1 Tax=Vicia faba TaxID=3906 RepID=A0AAV1B402_VICFA|nr:unnamed protein product [Vicia faba]
MATYMPERVMCQFGYTQTIPQGPVVSAPPLVKGRDMNALFDDYENHLVPDEAQSTIAPDDWSYADCYIIWFFRVSHPYLVQDAPGNPPRPSHQEILEKEQTQTDHATDVLPRCRRIMEIVQTSIDGSLFPDGSDVRVILDTIMAEAWGALQHKRQQRNAEKGDGSTHSPPYPIVFSVVYVFWFFIVFE